MNNLSSEEVNAIYCCISFAQDLRDAFDEGLIKLKWNGEGDDQSKRNFLTEKIGVALLAAHKLAGYDCSLDIYKSERKRLEALQRLSDLDQEMGLV